MKSKDPVLTYKVPYYRIKSTILIPTVAFKAQIRLLIAHHATYSLCSPPADRRQPRNRSARPESSRTDRRSEVSPAQIQADWLRTRWEARLRLHTLCVATAECTRVTERDSRRRRARLSHCGLSGNIAQSDLR